jgi:hypothetical protein
MTKATIMQAKDTDLEFYAWVLNTCLVKLPLNDKSISTIYWEQSGEPAITESFSEWKQLSKRHMWVNVIIKRSN